MTVEQPNPRTERRVDGNAAWLNALLDAIVVITPDGSIVEWNEAAERTFGWRKDQAVGQMFADLCIPEEFRAAHEAGLARWRETGVQVVTGKRLELPALRADGRRIEVELTVTLAEGWSGPVFVGFLRDITELREAQRAVEANEHRFRAIVEHSPAIISILGRDGTWQSSTTAGSRILGWQRGLELEGGIFALVHPDDLEYAMATFNEVVAGTRGPDDPVDFRVRAADGSWHWIETAADNLLDDPQVDAIVLHSRDVTERRRHDALMAQSNERLSALVENLNAAVLVEDSDRRMAIANQQFCDMFGIPVPPAALLGSDCAAAAEQSKALFADPEGWLASVEAALAGGEQLLDIEFGLADGRTVERDYIPIRVDDRNEGHVWIYRDVTERHEMAARRERLLDAERDVRRAIEDQNERLRELDRLKSDFVANVSHELRTPLTSIRGAVAASRLVEDRAQRTELLDVIERQALRLQGMVEEILASARMEREQAAVDGPAEEPPLLRKVDLGALVRLAALDAQLAGHPVTVDAPEHYEVRADPEGLRRVVGNLIENAHKYGSAPVTVTLAQEQEHVVLSVIDRGPGVPLEDRERIFERFYRADPNGVQPGLGLGLSIVRGVVESSGGHVWVDDAPGGGAAFRVALHVPADEWREAADVR